MPDSTTRTGPWLWAFGLLAAALGFGMGTRARPATEWGVYQIYRGHERFEKNLDLQLAELGGKPSYAMFFRDLNQRRSFPKEAVRICRERNLVPVISLELLEWRRRGREENYLARIVSGELDDFFRQWARGAAAEGGRVILRFGFEMNGDWFTWGKQPKLFKQAWVRARSIFLAEKAANVQWMFSPNILYGKLTFEKDILPYYPGREQVDLLGLDGYNFGDDHDQWHQWQSYEEVFAASIAAMNRLRQPLFLAEIGCAHDKRKAAWMKDFLANVSKDRRVVGFVYFNLNKQRGREPDWRISSDSESLRVFKTWVAAQAPD